MTTAPRTDGSLFERLVDEYLARLRRGDAPDPDEYAARHPELASEIRDVFPTLGLLEVLGSVPGSPAGAAPPPRVLGEYRVLREAGRGGMGVVYEAVQLSLGRHVALKVLDADRAAKGDRAERFRREAKAAARLHHSNIVPVFAVGEQDGASFYAMQYIRGQSLAAVLDELRGKNVLGPSSLVLSQTTLTFGSSAVPASDDRTAVGDPAPPPSDQGLRTKDQGRSTYFRNVARLGAQVADALDHAHRQGVVHRDVKPSNLLLDAAGTVWVTDFGLAKLADADDLTETGALLGTLAYMAPEQLDGAADGRSDVYGLGVTLYELACLRPAFRDDNRVRLIDKVRTSDPPRPRAVDPAVPRDLETVVLKAMAREPHRRYASAAALADDLRRFADGRAVRARRAGWAGQASRWAKRNPAVAALLVAVFGLLTAVAGVSVWAAAVNGRETARARAEEAKAVEQAWRAKLAEARAVASSREPGQRFRALELLDAALAEARRAGLADADRAAFRDVAATALCQADILPAREWDALEGDRNGWNAGFAFDANLTRYARADAAGGVRVAAVDGDRTAAEFPGPGPVKNVYLSPDGRRLAVLSNPQYDRRLDDWFSDRLTVHALPPDRPATVLDVPGKFCGVVRFSPDGRRLAACEPVAGYSVFDLAAGRRHAHPIPAGEKGRYFSFSPDGQALVFAEGAGDGRWRLCEWRPPAAARRLPLAGDLGYFHTIEHHPGGGLLAVATAARRVNLFESAAGRPAGAIDARGAHGTGARFDAAGVRLVTLDWSNRLRVWDAWSGRPLVSVGFQGPGFVFGAGGRSLAAQAEGPAGRLQILRYDPGRELVAAGHPEPDGGLGRHAVFCSPRDRLAAADAVPPHSGHQPNGFALFDPATGRRLAPPVIADAGPVGFLPAGDLLTAGAGGLLRWPRAEPTPGVVRFGPPRPLVPGDRVSYYSTATADGTAVVSAVNWADAVVSRAGGPPTRIASGMLRIQRPAISPDGRWVAVARHGAETDGRNVRVFDAATGALVCSLAVDTAKDVGFSPDGRWLWAGSGAGRTWRVGTWEPGPAAGGWAFAFAVDGTLAATDAGLGVVRLFDPATGAELARLTAADAGRIYPRAFTPAGDRLLAHGDQGRHVYVWDLRLIREGLAARGLDWDRPPYPPASDVAPATVEIVLGGYEHNRAAERAYAGRKWADAAAAWTKSLAADPDQPDVCLRLARLLLRDDPGRTAAAALPLAERAVAGRPDWEAHFYRGDARYHLGDPCGAAADLTRALDLGVPPADARHAGAHHLRGLCLDRLGDHAAALADADRAIALRPPSANVLLSRAWYLARLNRPAEAVPAFAAGLNKNPAPDVARAARRQLAWLLLAGPADIRDPCVAAAEVEAVAADEPTRLIDTSLLRAVVQYRLGEYAEADRQLARLEATAARQNMLATDDIRLFRAACRYHLGDRPAAEKLFAEATRGRAGRAAVSVIHAARFEAVRAEVRQAFAAVPD